MKLTEEQWQELEEFVAYVSWRGSEGDPMRWDTGVLEQQGARDRLAQILRTEETCEPEPRKPTLRTWFGNEEEV